MIETRLRNLVRVHGYDLPASSKNNMIKTGKTLLDKSGDLVLEEIRRIKDRLSMVRGHDVHRLFAVARKRQRRSGHRVVNLEEKTMSSKI